MEQVPNFFGDFGRVLTDLEKSRFYGTLELKFREGKVVLCTKTETFTPTDRGTAESNRMNGASKNSD